MIAVLIGASLIFSGYDRKRLKYTYKMKGFNNFFYPFACWLYRHFVKGHTQKTSGSYPPAISGGRPRKRYRRKSISKILHML